MFRVGKIPLVGVIVCTLGIFGIFMSQHAVYADDNETYSCIGYGPYDPEYQVPCADSTYNSKGTRVGHEEPTAEFFSNAPNSGNNMEWAFTIPGLDPVPTTDGTKTAWYQLSPTFWISIDLCDPGSMPAGNCVPDSDTNNPSTAGSAILELQFYPPQPSGNSFNPSAGWTAALTIDSPSAFFGKKCPEIINNKQMKDDGTSNPLVMNANDNILVNIHDTNSGMQVTINDLTTGHSSTTVSSSANGYVHYSNPPNDCTTTGFDFHPEWATANTNNVSPNFALSPNVAFDFEIGHAELAPGDNDADDNFNTCNSALATCFTNDNDTDGFSYQADWPDGTANHPSTVIISSPMGNGIGPDALSSGSNYNVGYSKMGFESSSNVFSSGVPFYPFFSLAGSPTNLSQPCVLIFGNDYPGGTISGTGTVNDFGKNNQYRDPNGSPVSNQFNNPCQPSFNQTSLSTTIVNATTSVPLSGSPPTVFAGSSVEDTALLSNATLSFAGSVTYTLYNGLDCSGSVNTSQNIPISTGGTLPSSNPVQVFAGKYGFKASYSGDKSNSASTSACEPLIVVKRPINVTTAFVNDTSGQPLTGNPPVVPAGEPIHDTTAFNVTNANGNIAYVRYNSPDCTGSATSVSNGVVANSVAPSSSPVTYNNSGIFSWQGLYSNDLLYLDTNSTCEPVKVVSIHVTKGYTETNVDFTSSPPQLGTPLNQDGSGNYLAMVVLAHSSKNVVSSTNPGQVYEEFNITSDAQNIPIKSITAVDTLPINWNINPNNLGAVTVLFQAAGGNTLKDITSSATVTLVQATNPTTGQPNNPSSTKAVATINISDLTASTSAGKALAPGDKILVYVKMKYALKGDNVNTTTYPVIDSSTAQVNGFSGTNYLGFKQPASGSAPLKVTQ